MPLDVFGLIVSGRLLAGALVTVAGHLFGEDNTTSLMLPSVTLTFLAFAVPGVFSRRDIFLELAKFY